MDISKWRARPRSKDASRRIRRSRQARAAASLSFGDRRQIKNGNAKFSRSAANPPQCSLRACLLPHDLNVQNVRVFNNTMRDFLSA